MAVKLCFYEDERARNFLPLVYLRPVYDLKCGVLTLREKAQGLEHDELVLHCRGYLTEAMRERTGAKVNEPDALSGDVVVVNGRAVLSSSVLERVRKLSTGEALVTKDGELVAARVEGRKLKWLKDAMSDGSLPPVDAWKASDLKTKKVDALVLSWLWDITEALEEGEVIADDIERVTEKRRRGTVDDKTVVYGEKLFVEEGARVYAGVVLDTEEGPVFIEKGAKVKPPTIIEGPCYIGADTIIDGAKIRPGAVIGPVCRIGGEVEASVVHAYTNKHHEGFLGHAYVGEWVNIGAMATNSDLKNNYSIVRVYVNGEMVNTGLLKVGCFIADHVKVGIGVMFNTGAVVGVAANIWGAEVTPKFVPSFAWGNPSEGFVVHELDKAIKTARNMMSRRKVELTKTEEELLRRVFELTAEERKQAGVRET